MGLIEREKQREVFVGILNKVEKEEVWHVDKKKEHIYKDSFPYRVVLESWRNGYGRLAYDTLPVDEKSLLISKRLGLKKYRRTIFQDNKENLVGFAKTVVRDVKRFIRDDVRNMYTFYQKLYLANATAALWEVAFKACDMSLQDMHLRENYLHGIELKAMFFGKRIFLNLFFDNTPDSNLDRKELTIRLIFSFNDGGLRRIKDDIETVKNAGGYLSSFSLSNRGPEITDDRKKSEVPIRITGDVSFSFPVTVHELKEKFELIKKLNTGRSIYRDFTLRHIKR